jgi:hypothetical protein
MHALRATLSVPGTGRAAEGVDGQRAVAGGEPAPGWKTAGRTA